MKYTLLEMTQRILESMESDEVSSINETPESQAVANIIKECYFDIIGDQAPMDTKGLFKLTSSADNTKPTLMTLPATVSKIDWLRYNIGTLANPDWQDLRRIDNEEFYYYQNDFDVDEVNVATMTVTINSQSFIFKYKNDDWPQYYTIFDEQYLIFDSYDVTVEDNLEQVRTLGFGELIPSFSLTNSFIPDLDPRQFQLLLQEAKSTAFIELKQTPNPKAESKARRNRIVGQKIKADHNQNATNQPHASYGRKGYTSPMKWAMRNGQ